MGRDRSRITSKLPVSGTLVRRTPLRRVAPMRSAPLATGTLPAGVPAFRRSKQQAIPKAVAPALARRDRRWLRTEMDRLARFCCLARAGNCCEKCGKPGRMNEARSGLQWHHVYTRALVALRWDMDNLVCLCAGCHLWWHHNPLDAAAWFVGHFGQARADRLRIVRGTVRRLDVEAQHLLLRQTAEQYGHPRSGTEG